MYNLKLTLSYTFFTFSDPAIPNNLTLISQCEADDYQSYFDSCYRMETAPATFDEALQTCRSESAELASFSDRYHEAFALTVLYSNRLNDMWIGLARSEVGKVEIAPLPLWNLKATGPV